MLRLSLLILLALVCACAAKRPVASGEEPLDPSIKPLTVEQEEQTR